MKPHPHASAMAEYAEDAAETDRPWERWELKKDTEWLECVQYDMLFFGGYEYRRKPRTIRIGEFDVPEPMQEAPEIGTIFHLAHISSGKPKAYATQWRNTHDDIDMMNAGICHTTREAAELHAKALLSFTQQSNETNP